MKNGLIIWNVILSLVAGFLLVMQFSSKKGNSPGKKTNERHVWLRVNNSVWLILKWILWPLILILVKDVKTELTKKEEAINTEMTNRTKAIQQKYNYYQNQAQAGKLSETQSEAASKEIKKMDDEMKNRKQQLDQEYNNFMMTKQNEIKTKIEAFIKEYNKTRIILISFLMTGFILF